METGLESLGTWPGTVTAAGWTRRGGPPVLAGQADAVLPLASVTKLLTTMAVLVAVEEEVLALDEPAGPPGSTLRLLLCHASGLPFQGRAPVTPPGTRRIYGNAAFELAGELLAARSGIALHDYVREAVCEPLEMTATTFRGSPASGATGTVRDLLRLGDELLAPGRVIAPATLAAATQPQLPDLPGVLPGFGRHRPNPWGIGFELHGEKCPHWMPVEASAVAFGHFGRAGSFLWVDPLAGVACAALGDEPFGDWAVEAWPRLGAAVLRVAADLTE